MTVGNVVSDRTFPVTDSNGSYSGRGGEYYSRVWSGGDRSKTGRPSPPTFVPSFREYAGDLNLNRFKRSQRLAILGDVYSRWRTARDFFFTQLKAYHIAKAKWRKESRGEMHPYNLYVDHTVHGVGDYWNVPGKFGGNGVSLSGSFGWSSCNSGWTSEDDISLINKIRGKLDGGVGFQTGVALAEVDQTLSMIRSNAKRFRRIGESLVSGDLNKALRVAFNGSAANHIKGFSGLRGIADNYLLYQFGVKPLVHDVLDAARSYGYKSGRPKLIRVSVRKRVTTHGSTSHGFWNQKSECQVRKSIVCYLHTDELADESGVLDLPSILWERVPYSFVVDWWVNVGAYLSALHMARTVNGLTQFCQTSTERTTIGPITSGSVYTITSNNGGFNRSVRQIRTISKSLVVPPPSVRPILHGDTEVRLRHTLEAISLIAQKGPAFRSAFNRLQGG